MKKSDLVKHLADTHGITLSLANRLLKSLTDTITDSVASGNRIAFPGLGSFSTTVRPARSLVTPHGTKVEVPAHTAVKFSPAKALKQAARATRVKKSAK